MSPHRDHHRAIGDPFDGHYHDQIETWIAGRTEPFGFTPAAIAAATAATETMTP